MRATFLSVLIALAIVGSSEAQTGYTVTATLDPVFVDLRYSDGPRTLRPISGLTRGADGGLYGFLGDAGSYFVAIVRISPTTGTTRTLYLLYVPEGTPEPWFYRGRKGRLYFTMQDSVHDVYNYGGPECSYGCILMLETGGSEPLLSTFHRFYYDSDIHAGKYPRDGVEMEDTDGALYVRSGEVECEPGWGLDIRGALVKIDLNGESTVLESCGGPAFDWSTVTPSGNNVWRWSDGKTYATNDSTTNDAVYQTDPLTGTSVRLTTIAASDGSPLWELAEGSGYVYGMTCCGGALNGGVVFRIRVPSLASPDLVVGALSVPPLLSAPGFSFGVTDTTRNAGPEPAAKSVTKYHLSRTGENADIKLSGNRYVPELYSEYDSVGAVTAKIPASAPAGTYWLVACADALKTVAESSDANNCLRSSSTITLAKSDLVVSALELASVVLAAGGKFTLTSTTTNAGGGPAPESLTRYLLTRSGERLSLLTGTSKVPVLAPSASYTHRRTVTLPPSIPTGVYRVLACADDKKTIAEVDESNNCRMSEGAITVR